MKLPPRSNRPFIFADPSAFFALTDRIDRFHGPAVSFFESNERLLVTGHLIIHETVTLIRMRLSHELAVKAGRWLFDQTVIPLIRVMDADERKAWKMFQRYRDKRFSFVDCTSFVLMQRLGIDSAFAFDEDFRQFGKWVVYPQTQ